MMKSFSNFINTLQSITEIPQSQADKICSMARRAELEKGECFIRAGDVPEKFAFVTKGLFRYYYLNKKGDEFTKGFFLKNTFISSYSAMIQDRASYFTIQALENSEIIVIRYRDWERLLQDHDCWTRVLLSFIEKGFCVKEAREREFLLFNAMERYTSFLELFPGLEKRIKQHMIASYVGITPVALSRIRKKMKIVNPG